MRSGMAIVGGLCFLAGCTGRSGTPASTPARRSDSQAQAPPHTPWPASSGRPLETRATGWPPRGLLLDLAVWDAAPRTERLEAAKEVAQHLAGFSFKGLTAFSAGNQRHEIAILVHGPTGMEFSLVPGGHFVMGSPADEQGRADNEPQRPVDVWPFLAARTEVTQAVWEQVMGANPSKYEGSTRPVESISWDQASDFCGREGFALPTEAQWEYAARAGTRTAFPTGAHMASLQGFANISDKYLHGHRSEVPYPIDNFSFEDAITDGFATTAPVASFRPNAFGLHDIIGNVMEWCDGVSLDREQSHLPVRPLRGGNWASTLRIVRSASHHGAGAHSAFDGVGFRPIKRLGD